MLESTSEAGHATDDHIWEVDAKASGDWTVDCYHCAKAPRRQASLASDKISERPIGGRAATSRCVSGLWNRSLFHPTFTSPFQRH